jgi:hypothetical protein
MPPDLPPPPPATSARGLDNPVVESTGDVDVNAAGSVAFVVSGNGILPVDLEAATLGMLPSGFTGPFALASSPSGVALRQVASAGKPDLFFLQSSPGAIGAIDTAGSGVLTESAFTLENDYPGDIAFGVGDDASYLYVVESPFGGRSAVRAFDTSSYDTTTNTLAETISRRFDDPFTAGAAPRIFDNVIPVTASLALVTYTTQGTGGPGGVFIFNPTNPADGYVNIAAPGGTGFFVSGALIVGDKLIISQDQVAADFSPLPGRLLVYQIGSMSPFAVRDQDASNPGTDPLYMVETTNPNPQQLTAYSSTTYGELVLVINAPFGGDASVDVLSLASGELLDPVLLDGPVTDTAFLPEEMVVRGRKAYLGTEKGLLSFDLVP